MLYPCTGIPPISLLGMIPPFLNSKHMESIGPNRPVCKHFGVRAGSGKSGRISLLGSESPARSRQAARPSAAANVRVITCHSWRVIHVSVPAVVAQQVGLGVPVGPVQAPVLHQNATAPGLGSLTGLVPRNSRLFIAPLPETPGTGRYNLVAIAQPVQRHPVRDVGRRPAPHLA